MSMSATDLITQALRKLGVVDPVDTPSAEEVAIGQRALAAFVDGLGAERAAMFYELRTVAPLTASVATYTIGTGGVINIARPNWIDRVSVRPDRTVATITELPLGPPLTVRQWQEIPVKTTIGSYPTAIYYDHNWVAGLGLITVYPVPNNSNADLVLYTAQAAPGFANLTTVYTFPPGWERMYIYNLAIEMADDFGAHPSSRVERIAAQSLATVKRSNWRAKDAALDPAMPGLRGRGRFNLTSGDYGGAY